MADCPRCGTENAGTAAVCSQCGTRLSPAGPSLAKTMVGGTTPLADTANQKTKPADQVEVQRESDIENERDVDGDARGFEPVAREPRPGGLPKTVLGMPSPFRASEEGGGSPDRDPQRDRDPPRDPGSPSANEGAGLGGTMLGMPSPLGSSSSDAASSEENREGEQGAQRRKLGGTMLGMPSPVKQQGATPPETGRPHLGGTMLGMPAVPKEALAAGPTRAKRPDPLSGTMVGMPSPFRPHEADSSPEGADSEEARGTAGPERQPGATDARKDPLAGTMLGMGQHEPASTDATLLEPAKAGRSPDNQPTDQKFKGTLMGIAQPGIAPTGQPAPRPPPEAWDANRTTRSPSRPPSVYPSSYPSQFPPPPKPFWKNALLIAMGLLLAGSLGGFLALFNKNPLTVAVNEFSVDDQGRDRLKLLCATCPEGSTLTLGNVSARVENEQATLRPEKPLDLGKNTLRFTLTTQNGESLKVAPLVLPIAFRVQTDWDAMNESPPSGRVLVQAPPGSQVTIDGNPIPLEGQRAEYRVDLSEQATGEERSNRRVSLSLPVEVQMEGSTKKAQATLKGTVAPLTLTAPGPFHELGGKDLTVTGRTAPLATVTAGDVETTAAKDGTFSLQLPAPEPQILQVRASGKHLITRTVSIGLVKQVTDDPDVKTKYSELAAGGEARLRAAILEARVQDGITRALAEVADGCKRGPCVVRLVYAEPVSLETDKKVTVTGWVTPGEPITVRVSKFH